MTRQTPHIDNDLALVVLMKNGNELAFQKIYDTYWERLFAYAYNRLHNRETSEEIVQDVFFALWEKRESILITSSLSGYLYGATNHRLLKEFRSAKVRKNYASDYALFIKNRHDNSNVEHQDLNDVMHVIESNIFELPKQCQLVFRLSRQEHIPNRRIAERLKISTKTVENYLTKALKHIRTSMGEILLLVVCIITACP